MLAGPEQCPLCSVLYSNSLVLSVYTVHSNLSLSGPASSPARKQSQCCPGRLGRARVGFSTQDWSRGGGGSRPWSGLALDLGGCCLAELQSCSGQTQPPPHVREGNLAWCWAGPTFLMFPAWPGLVSVVSLLTGRHYSHTRRVTPPCNHRLGTYSGYTVTLLHCHTVTLHNYTL